MKKYDFQTVIDRTNTGSSKWDDFKKMRLTAEKGIVPFSVADMEFMNAPEIIQGLKDYLDTAPLGYSHPYPEYLNAVCGWIKKRHNWEINPEWIAGSAGVVGALFACVKAFSQENEGVIIMPPVYFPFSYAAEFNNRKLVKCPLIRENDSYKIDYAKFESLAKEEDNKILLFCSPHNPVGRVWTKDELLKLGEICVKNNIVIVSDEIHFDITMPGHTHIPMPSVNEAIANICLMCTSASKTFNLAGMQASNIIIPNKELRDQYVKTALAQGFHVMGVLGYKSVQIAYSQAESWFDEVMEVIYDNHLQLKKYCEENIPVIKAMPLEGTYLQWLDFSALNMSDEEIEKMLLEEADLCFDSGYIFGEGGEGMQRMNIACPKSTMIAGLERLKKVLAARKYI